MSVLESSINTSPSKQKYSFPKSERFKEKYNSNCSQAFYVLPSLKTEKATSLGYGNKYDFSKNANKNPGPNVYSVHREFDDKNAEKKGFSIGIGRENLYRNNKNLTPGPGTYGLKGTLNQRDISFGLKGNDALVPKNLISIPGPGAYNVINTLRPDGKYYLAKIKNPPVHSFNPPHITSPFAKDSKDPGPGHYNVKNDFNPTGSYFIAKYKSNNAHSFSKSCRTEPTIRSVVQNPGPGSYGYYSDFGVLPPIKPFDQNASQKSIKNVNSSKINDSKTADGSKD